jgi:hypothetical protein
MQIVVPPWSRLLITLSSKVFDNIFGYYLAVFVLIIGLRVKLLGEGDRFIQLIDGNLLAVSGILILLSGVLWKICEFSIFLKIPDIIQENGSMYKYLDSAKKGAIPESKQK